jgi:hypothetical protein
VHRVEHLPGQPLRLGGISLFCGGNQWVVGQCGTGIELTATGGLCQCQMPGWTVRPCIGMGDPNWGGVNTTTCNAPNQTMTVVFQ